MAVRPRMRRLAGGRGLVRLARQRGATLIIGLILLVLVTVGVVAAYNVGSSNLKVVANVQARDESIGSARIAMEQVIGSNFTNNIAAQTPQTIQVDIDGDLQTDYTVVVAVPLCVRAVQASGASPSEVELGEGLSTSAFWNTDWEIRAVLTNASTGATVRMVQGVRLRQNESDKNNGCCRPPNNTSPDCPPAPSS